MKKIRVKIIYRNYKPIHTTYDSFISHPPKDVEYILPQVKTNLAKLMPIYRKFGDRKFVKILIKQLQRLVFERTKNNRSNSSVNTNYDLIHYIQICPNKVPAIPFIIDIEHVAALSNFVHFSKQETNKIINILAHDNCKAIIALSLASEQSLKNLVKGNKNANKVINKVQIIYPAVENYSKVYGNTKEMEKNMKDHNRDLNILFVGSNPYNKGLFDFLEAIKRINNPSIKVNIITNLPKRLIKKWESDRIQFFKPIYSHNEVIKRFFLHADLFVLPTRGDTFGMVFLDALASGLPVITTKQYAAKEIIRDGINGYLLNSKNVYLEKYDMPTRKIVNLYNNKPIDNALVKKLIEKITMLYEDRDRLNTMSRNALNDFSENGRFAISNRNAKLTSVYRNALNEKIH